MPCPLAAVVVPISLGFVNRELKLGFKLRGLVVGAWSLDVHLAVGSGDVVAMGLDPLGQAAIRFVEPLVAALEGQTGHLLYSWELADLHPIT